ncbi:hypothetical protein DUT91_22625 [Phyllobacterium salinisoli]|uniref:Uncharacterized protein n=1 Tax=Phyllobacterium salinisoli TaxID=1899321 RepID=A0A368JXN4_9HYPH|nr:hypothetical protein DUT91_22625 [Phyllobacterium salinisoli]
MGQRRRIRSYCQIKNIDRKVTMAKASRPATTIKKTFSAFMFVPCPMFEFLFLRGLNTVFIGRTCLHLDNVRHLGQLSNWRSCSKMVKLPKRASQKLIV